MIFPSFHSFSIQWFGHETCVDKVHCKSICLLFLLMKKGAGKAHKLDLQCVGFIYMTFFQKTKWIKNQRRVWSSRTHRVTYERGRGFRVQSDPHVLLRKDDDDLRTVKPATGHLQEIQGVAGLVSALFPITCVSFPLRGWVNNGEAPSRNFYWPSYFPIAGIIVYDAVVV